MHFVLSGQILLRARHLLSAGSSSELVLVHVLCELVEVVLVDEPCELDVDPDWRGGTGTGG